MARPGRPRHWPRYPDRNRQRSAGANATAPKQARAGWLRSMLRPSRSWRDLDLLALERRRFDGVVDQAAVDPVDAKSDPVFAGREIAERKARCRRCRPRERLRNNLVPAENHGHALVGTQL